MDSYSILIIANFSSTEVSNSTSNKPTSIEIWGIGIFAVTIINSCAIMGVSLMPLLGETSYDYMLTCLIGLGVGSLTGSALFHLMPDAFGLRDDWTDRHIWKCWIVVTGIYLFFTVDRILKIIALHKRNKWRLRPAYPHVCQYGLQVAPLKEMSDSIKNIPSYNIDQCISEKVVKMQCTLDERKEMKPVETECGEIAAVAWMIIFGDAVHNFIDGLSIGAAFTKSILVGISMCIAVFCEELPYEFGDVAILVKSGMTMKQAVGYNLVASATSYFGFGLGVVIGEITGATVYIFAMATGTFLYVALANMVPEMNETIERAMEIGLKPGIVVVIVQCTGIAVGLLIMFLLAFYHSHFSI